jgi:glucose-6-phosphate 1-dehydrogenase
VTGPADPGERGAADAAPSRGAPGAAAAAATPPGAPLEPGPANPAVSRATPLAFVLFGASGDLAARKIYPALAHLLADGALPEPFVLIGVARTKWREDEFRERFRKAGVEAGLDPAALSRLDEIVCQCRYVAGDYGDDATFSRLAEVLADADAAGAAGNRLYYLATIPALFSVVADALGRHGLARPGPGGSFARLVVEKPFGTDLESAWRLDEDLHRSFGEDQIFRIDHYMGKETVQNLLALRFANAIFEPVWNRRYVDHVQVTVAESLGVEHRGSFYEGAGALRDIVQNHVMQVLSLTMMEPPVTVDATSIRDEKVKLLRSIVIPDAWEAVERAVRGQYGPGVVEGEPVRGYREEPGVSPESTTETFVALRLEVDNWRWAGVPVFARTGKRLARRATEVAMVFQRVPHLAFASSLVRELRPDALVLRIQPEEGISVRFGAKVPGPTFRLRSVAMDFSYRETFGGESPDAYERLLLDAMVGDATLFIRTDEVLQAWKVVAPFQQAFTSGLVPLSGYAAGTMGPVEATRLIEHSGRQWHDP